MNKYDYDQIVKNYLIDCMASENTSNYESLTTQQRITLCEKTYMIEVGSWREEQVGKQAAISEWLSGLCSGCSVDYDNYTILNLLEKWGAITAGTTESQKDKLLNGWFNYLAAKLAQLFSGYRIPKGSV